MATLSVSWTIADDKAAGVRDDFAAYHGYQALIEGKANPESQGAFIKRKLGEFIKESVKAYRATQAAQTARITSVSDTDAITLS